MKYFCTRTLIFVSMVIAVFCSSCDSDEPTSNDWNRDWDEEYERYEYTLPQPFDDIIPGYVIWHGEDLDFKSVKDMLHEEASKGSKKSKIIKTSSPGMLKDALGSKALEIDKLTIIGPVDEYDITYIKRCIAAGNLRRLDLSAAVLPDNKLPDNAFVLYEYPYMGVLCPAYLPLFNIILPEGIEIGDCALLNSLITEIDLSKVKSIGNCSFQRTVFLSKTIELTPATRNIGTSAFEEAGDGSLVVNFNQKIMPKRCFYLAKIKEINIAEGLESIEYCALFAVPTESLELPGTIKKIGDRGLFNCEVRQLSLPASIEELGECSLRWLTNLETLDVYFTNPDIAYGPKVGEVYNGHASTAFTKGSIEREDTPHDVKVTVPAVAIDAFKASPTWAWFNNITAR